MHEESRQKCPLNEYKPEGLLVEVVTFCIKIRLIEEAYIWREFCLSKSFGLKNEWSFASSTLK